MALRRNTDQSGEGSEWTVYSERLTEKIKMISRFQSGEERIMAESIAEGDMGSQFAKGRGFIYSHKTACRGSTYLEYISEQNFWSFLSVG